MSSLKLSLAQHPAAYLHHYWNYSYILLFCGPDSPDCDCPFLLVFLRTYATGTGNYLTAGPLLHLAAGYALSYIHDMPHRLPRWRTCADRMISSTCYASFTLRFLIPAATFNRDDVSSTARLYLIPGASRTCHRLGIGYLGMPFTQLR